MDKNQGYFSRLSAVAVVYFLTGKFGLHMAFVNASATAIWPPTGLSIAAFLLLGQGIWPGIFLGAFLVNITTSSAVLVSLGIAAGNTLEGLTAAWLIQTFAHGRRAFDQPYAVLKFALAAAVAAPIISATVGLCSLWLGGLVRPIELSSVWLTWWLGDAGGALIVAPALILWSDNFHIRWNRRQYCEAAVLLIFLISTGLIVFGPWFPSETKYYPLEFICMAIVVLTALRFSPREMAAANLCLSAIAIIGTLRGHGPFVRTSPNTSLLLLQGFMGANAVMGLAIAAVAAERDRANLHLRESESRFRQLSEDLEKKVAWRTRELTEVNKELESFSYSVSHDLRAPLRTIQGFSQLLINEHAAGLSAEGMQLLTTTQKRAEQLSRLIDDLLHFSRTTQQTVEKERLDIFSLAHQIVEEISLLEPQRSVQVEIHPLEPADANMNLIRQVLTNLISNAFKFTRHQANPQVEIGCRREGAETVYFVRDNGVGFDMKYAHKLFVVFQRLHTETEFEGTGVGLALVQRIIHKHGGRVWVEAKLDQGATFYFSLPATPEA